MKIVWSTVAQKRMNDFYDWYSVKNEAVAVRIFNEIVDSAETLRKFPQIAAIEPALDGFTRVYRSLIILELFKLIYFIDVENETIVVATVWNCRQDPKQLRNEIKE